MKILVVLLIGFYSLVSSSEFDNIKNQYFKSYDYERIGKYSEAIKVLAPLYKKYPNGYTINLRFGWLFYLEKKYTNALNYYKKASLTNNYALEPRLGLAMVYLETASYEKAQTVSYELLKIDYYNYYANLYAVKALIAQKKFNISKKIIFKMLNLYPTDITYLVQLAILYKNINDKKLQKLYEDILILDPNNIYVRSIN